MVVLLSSLFIFLAIGVPIAYSLGLSTTLYFLIFNNQLLQVMPQILFAGMDSYTLIALPLFILMGQLMNESQITSRLIDYCLIFVGKYEEVSDWLMLFPACCLGGYQALRFQTQHP